MKPEETEKRIEKVAKAIGFGVLAIVGLGVAQLLLAVSMGLGILLAIALPLLLLIGGLVAFARRKNEDAKSLLGVLALVILGSAIFPLVVVGVLKLILLIVRAN